MKLKRERLNVVITEEQEKKFWEELQKDFPSYLQSIKSQYQKKLGLPSLKISLNGEIFFSKDLFLYYLISGDRSSIEAGSLVYSEEEQERFQNFLARIRDILSEYTGASLPLWREVQVSNPRFNFLRDETFAVTAVEEDISASGELNDPRARELLRKIHSSGLIYLEKLIPEENMTEAAPALQKLEDKGLITREYVITCFQSGKHITTVSSTSELQDAAEKGFKCYVCGKPVSEEKIEQLLMCTPKGSRLSEPNYWLLLQVVELLKKYGIPNSNILYNKDKDSETVEVFVNNDHHLILFELKEKKIKMEEVFIYLSRIKYSKPNLSVLLTLEKPQKDILNLLAEKCDVPVYTIGSLEEFDEHIGTILAGKRRDYSQEVLARFELLTSAEVSSLITEYMYIPEELIQEVKEEVPAPLAEEAPPAEAPPPEAVLADASKIVEGMFEKIEEKIEAMEEVKEILEAEVQEALVEDFPAEIIPYEIYPATTAPPEDTLEYSVKRIVEEAQSGVSGKTSVIESMMQDMNSLNQCGSILVDSDGLLAVNAFPLSLDAEVTAAYSVEVSASFNRSLLEAGRVKPLSLTLEGRQVSYHLYPAGQMLLVVSEEEKARFIEDEEMAESPTGELALREAILKKVLEDLGAVEGVKANIVTSRDGLIIESFAREQIEKETYAALYGQLLVDNEKNLLKMGFDPVKQILIKTDSELISLIPLDMEGVLITFMEPNTVKDVWQSKLPGSAGMLASVLR